MKQWLPTTILFLSMYAVADSEKAPYAFIKASESGSCIFKMLPGTSPVGTAYKVEESGALSEQWKSKGWYSFQVYISDNCQYLIRFETSPSMLGFSTENEVVVLEFYKNGKLTKSYKAEDLVKDTKKLKRTVSHFQWQIYTQHYPTYEELGVLEGYPTFSLKTIEKQVITFKSLLKFSSILAPT